MTALYIEPEETATPEDKLTAALLAMRQAGHDIRMSYDDRGTLSFQGSYKYVTKMPIPPRPRE